MKVIEVLADRFPRTIVDILQNDSTNMEIILESNSLIFQLKEFLSDDDKEFFMQRLIPNLYQHAKRIHKLIGRSDYPDRVPYVPGRLWDFERTINNFLLSGESTFTYKHVICIQRKKTKNSVVLLIDKSHSVLNYLRLIILTSILFSLTVEIKNISLIGFDTEPSVIKGFNELTKDDDEVIRRLIEIKSGGKTDIFSAVKLAEKQLSQQINQKKMLVLISDLLATSGNDFLPLLKKIKDVRILITPKRRSYQLTKPILGYLHNLPNVRLYQMPSDERFIPMVLEQILYD